MSAQSLPLLLTLLAIGAGIFLNNKGLTDLKADLKADVSELKHDLKADIARIDTRLNSMQTDLQHFYELKGHLEGRIDEIAKRVA